MPNNQVQIRRGTTAQNAAFTGVQGEVTYDTDTFRLITHDGATVGGFKLVLLKGDTFTGQINFTGTTHAGIRLNNLTNAQMVAIAAPTAGMMVFDTDNAVVGVYNGIDWTPIAGNFAGAGSPEGNMTASPGSTYLNTDDESFWVKKTGTGDIGWIPKIA